MNYLDFIFDKNYKNQPLRSLPLLRAICNDNHIAFSSVRHACLALGITFSLASNKVHVDIPETLLSEEYVVRGYLNREILSFEQEILAYLMPEQSLIEPEMFHTLPTVNNEIFTHRINSTADPSIISPSLPLSFTLPGTGGVVESITAVIDEAGLKDLSKWIKPTGNNPTGRNLNLKLGERTIVTKSAMSSIPTIKSADFNAASFIADLEKLGVSLAYYDERLHIDASRLMNTSTGSEVLSNIIEEMKTYMSDHKDEVLKYLQKDH